MSKPILWGTIFWDHTGPHSAMAGLSPEIDKQYPDFIERLAITPAAPAIISRLRNVARRMAQLPPVRPQWMKIREQSPFYDAKSYGLEVAIKEKVAREEPPAVVLESVDAQLFLLAAERTRWSRTKLVGIAHQPMAWWQLNHRRHDLVKALDLLIVVASCTKTFWERYVDSERIVFIPHGVDTEFFVPTEASKKRSRRDGILRIVFSGQWLRDFETLAKVVKIADREKLPVCFELIVPDFARGTDACYQIAMSPRVRWHSKLADEELRDVYRESDLLLLTLRDSTANNGLLEAISCGLPAIVTDVGGVRDYVKGEFADLVPPEDPEYIIELLRQHIVEMDKLEARGFAARAHAKNQLSWSKVAKDYVTVLQRVI